MTLRKYRVAVCGATGAVGREIVSLLEERNFPISHLTLLASKQSVGKRIEYRDDEIKVEQLTADSFTGIDIALFSAGEKVSSRYAPIATKQKTIVVDNTSAFRMQPDVPLVVPEVNPQDIAGYTARSIIANPNCATIQLVMALKPIEEAVGIRRVVISTYQSVSGIGRKGVDELERQTVGLLNLKEVRPNQFPKQIAFNCLPQIAAFEADGYTSEEHKIIQETPKILHRADLKVSATCVRVPVFYSHAESVNIECQQKLSADKARSLLEQAVGIQLLDGPKHQRYPTQIETSGTDEVLVGRIREDPSVENGLALWVVADNIRKGAALNAVQIAEKLVADYLNHQ